MKNIKIKSKKLDHKECLAFVEDAKVGGVVSFIGTVRNHAQGEVVVKLEFEAYESMAISEMNKIADQALSKYEIESIVIHHRVGTLEIGEIPVIIIAAAAHRKPAFEACQFAIDTLKETVPIWKKEFLENGTHWVSAYP